MPTDGATDDSNSSLTSRHKVFLPIFTMHEPAIRAYIRQLVPLCSDADDVLQEVAVVLWERFDDFDRSGDFKAWAFGIARFKVLSYLRDLRRERLVLSQEAIELLAADAEEHEPRFDVQRRLLERCFSKLSLFERDLVIQAYAPQARIQDLARLSGRSVTGFYSWLYRMRLTLVRCVKREQARGAIQ